MKKVVLSILTAGALVSASAFDVGDIKNGDIYAAVEAGVVDFDGFDGDASPSLNFKLASISKEFRVVNVVNVDYSKHRTNSALTTMYSPPGFDNLSIVSGMGWMKHDSTRTVNVYDPINTNVIISSSREVSSQDSPYLAWGAAYGYSFGGDFGIDLRAEYLYSLDHADMQDGYRGEVALSYSNVSLTFSKEKLNFNGFDSQESLTAKLSFVYQF